MSNRRNFIASSLAVAASVGGPKMLALPDKNVSADQRPKGVDVMDKAEDPRITRARLSGPPNVTKDATVAVLGAEGKMTVLAQGTNEWVCVPGDENKIGQPPMCMNPMGTQWMMDAMQGKPRPSNTAPGIIYMLCGATQRSNTDPLDRTSPAIPIGPHWMVLWPFEAALTGLPTTVRDRGSWIMFAGTPYAYLHVCGSPWEGREYHEGDKAVWTMNYERP